MRQRPADAAVRPDDAIFVTVPIANLRIDRAKQLPMRVGQVFRMRRIANDLECHRPIHRKTVNLLCPIIVNHLAAKQVVVPHALLGGRKRNLQPLLHPPLSLASVAVGAQVLDECHRLVRLALNAGHRQTYRNPRPVRPQILLVERIGMAALQELIERLPLGGVIFGWRDLAPDFWHPLHFLSVAAEDLEHLAVRGGDGEGRNVRNGNAGNRRLEQSAVEGILQPMRHANRPLAQTLAGRIQTRQ